MPDATWYIFAWLSWAVLANIVLHNPRGDVATGLIYHAVRLYARLFHRVRVLGAGTIPARGVGPLIVVCNHTAGVDPLLVSTAVPFEVRWMMGLDMMHPRLALLWEHLRIIGVNRKGRDLAGTREALRHLASGGVVGVFPEGGLERPAHRFRPFHPGVGFLIARSGAPVLPVWIDGTPQVDPAWASLWHRGHAQLTFGPIMRFDRGDSPDAVTGGIRDWFSTVSGWPPAR